MRSAALRWASVAVAMALVGPVLIVASGEDSAGAPVALSIDGKPVPWRTLAVPVHAGATLRLDVDTPGVSVEVSDGTLVQTSSQRWQWMAPAIPGDATIDVKGAHRDERVRLRMFVVIPASQVRGGFLNAFRIGDYPTKPLRGHPGYRPPDGFIEVRRDNADSHVSPHFRLKQFLAKQESEYPKYLVLDPALVTTLEYVLAKVRQAGHDVDTLHVMSGYRTPFYNRAIGNTTTFSQHEWGRAADIFVDRDGDDLMDDLNGDGQIDRRDADVLERWVQQVEEERHRPGGLSAYPGTRTHGPFVHVDVRGTRARW